MYIYIFITYIYEYMQYIRLSTAVLTMNTWVSGIEFRGNQSRMLAGNMLEHSLSSQGDAHAGVSDTLLPP